MPTRRKRSIGNRSQVTFAPDPDEFGVENRSGRPLVVHTSTREPSAASLIEFGARARIPCPTFGCPGTVTKCGG